MLPLLTAQQIGDMDQSTIQDYGLAGEVLMGFAGKSIFDDIYREFDQTPPEPVILVGKGNNGGDGLVMAHFFLSHGIAPHVIFLWPPEQLSQTSAYYWKVLQKQEVPYTIIETAQELANSLEDLLPKILQKNNAVLLFDAILGTGLSSPLKGRLAEMTKVWQEQKHPRIHKIAVDIPTGINGSGDNLGEIFFQSHRTYTMGLPKIGLYTMPGRRAAGLIKTVNIGFPLELTQAQKHNGHLLQEKDLYPGSGFLPTGPAMDGHKFHRGVTYIIAGSPGLEGAALLTARAAFAAGSGLVQIWTRPEVARILAGKAPEIQVRPVDAQEIANNMLELAQNPKKASSFVLGPGLGRDNTAQQTIQTVAETILNHREDFAHTPMLWDADALVLLAPYLNAGDNSFFQRLGRSVLTPHHGELKALFGESGSAWQQAVAEQSQNKVQSTLRLSQGARATLLTKGIDTVIATPTGEFFVNATGHETLARGGSGDLLAGILGSFLAAQLEPAKAAASAAYLLGLAAQKVGDKHGPLVGSPEFLLDEIIKILSQWSQR